MRPNRQMSTAASHVTTNIPAMTNPAVLMLKWSTTAQKPRVRSRPPISRGSRPRASIPPMAKQIATDRPVMARL